MMCTDSGGFAVEMTPEIQRAVAIVNGFTASNFGVCEPDLVHVERIKEAARRILEHVYGPLTPEGLPQKGIGREIVSAIVANENKVRKAISQNVVAGKTEPADYYEVLCQVLTDSGLAAIPAMLPPSTARKLLARSAAAEVVAVAGDACALCAICSACSACSVCSACGTCIVSVVIGAGAAVVVVSVVSVGTVAGYFFS